MDSVLDRTRTLLAGFDRRQIVVNGVDTVVYSAGQGDALVYLHGSGTFTGFAFANAWTKTHRVIIPYHPGFGESGDDPSMDTIQDYVVHYLDLFDALGLDRLSLVGSSLGGWLAAEIAVTQAHRLDKLVLAAPGGLIVRQPPSTDLFAIPAKEIGSYLVADPAVLAPYLPAGHDLEFLALRYRETTSSARLLWERPGNPKLEKWLHRITPETLLLWGGKDRIRPVAQAQAWLKRLPNARLEVIDPVGHLPLDEAPAAAALVQAFLTADARSAALPIARHAS